MTPIQGGFQNLMAMEYQDAAEELKMEAKQVPLIDLLKAIPEDARLIIQHDAFSSSSHPVGRLCHEAAAALSAALAKEQDSFIGLELSEIDEAINSNMQITDHRLRDGVYGAILDIELLLKEKNEKG